MGVRLKISQNIIPILWNFNANFYFFNTDFLKFSADFYFFNAYFVKSMPIYKKINYATFIQSKLVSF